MTRVQPHLTRQTRQWLVFTPMSSLFYLVPLLTPLLVSAGCVTIPEVRPDQLTTYVVAFIFLCFLVVAVAFILLAAGVEIKIPRFGEYRPPANRTGRIFLAAVGVFLLSFLVDFAGRAGLASLSDSQRQGVSDLPSASLIEMSVPSVEDRRFVYGEVSFDKYEDAFKEHYSKLTIHIADADGTPFEPVAEVLSDGWFVFEVSDLPSGERPTMVTWSADNLGDYVLWPIEPVEIVAQTRISFTFEEVDDFFYRHKSEAIEAVRACDVEKADAELTALVAVLERFENDLRPQTQTWPHDVYRDLADETASHRSCAQNAWLFERKWRREAIERATNRDSRIRAMNAWADYSRQVYRPNEQAWEWNSTLDNVVLVQEEYEKYLRRDLQLIMMTLAETSVRELVSKTMDSPAHAGCLSRGQRDALRSFELLLPPEPERGVYLNQMMNALSGLHHVVTPYSRLGIWIDYPYQGAGEIEIVRRELESESRYYYWYQSNEECAPGDLAFVPEESAPRRFELTSTDRIFVILDDGSLQMNPGGNFRAKQPGG